ncbi:MAG: hypothetical protein U0667_03120 [Chloroflexota bacterium]
MTHFSATFWTSQSSGGDPQAARLELGAGLGVLAAQRGAHLVEHLPHEVGRPPVARRLVHQDYRLPHRRLEVGRAVGVARERPPRWVVGQQAQDVVAPHHHRRVVGHDEAAGVRVGAAGVAGVDRLRVAHQVIRAGCLRDARQDGRLGQRQLREVVDAEVAARGGLHAVAVVAIEVLVEVGGDDVFLGVRLRQPHGLDELQDLALGETPRQHVLGQQPLPHQLLGDGGGAASSATDGVDRGRQDAQRVEAGVGPEGPVLHRGRGVDEDGRELAEPDHLPRLARGEARQDHVVAVVDDRLLGDRDVGQP